jgi:hypothetical protein
MKMHEATGYGDSIGSQGSVIDFYSSKFSTMSRTQHTR